MRLNCQFDRILKGKYDGLEHILYDIIYNDMKYLETKI